jgi:hypothetical protein
MGLGFRLRPTQVGWRYQAVERSAEEGITWCGVMHWPQPTRSREFSVWAKVWEGLIAELLAHTTNDDIVIETVSRQCFDVWEWCFSSCSANVSYVVNLLRSSSVTDQSYSHKRHRGHVALFLGQTHEAALAVAPFGFAGRLVGMLCSFSSVDQTTESTPVARKHAFCLHYAHQLRCARPKEQLNQESMQFLCCALPRLVFLWAWFLCNFHIVAQVYVSQHPSKSCVRFACKCTSIREFLRADNM